MITQSLTFALYTTNDNWILIAFCRKCNDFRAFRWDCIQRIAKTQDYLGPHKITLEQYFEECRKNGQPPLTYPCHKLNLTLQQIKTFKLC